MDVLLVRLLLTTTLVASLVVAASTAHGQPKPAAASARAGALAAPRDLPAEQRALAELDAVYQRVAEAGQRGARDDQLRLLRAALAIEPLPPKAGSLRGYLHYQIACIEAQLMRVDAALQSLERAGASGYDDAAHAKSDPDLAPLRANPRLAPALAVFERNRVELRVYDIVRFDSPDLGWAHLHEFEDITSPFFVELRTRYHLDDIVRGIPGETERQLALMAWVHNRWPHSGWAEPSNADALTILRDVEAGKRYRCVEYSVVLTQVLQAMGYPARVLSLGRDGLSFGLGKSHVVAEVWNNEHGKWLLVDAQNNGTWRADDAWLSAAEVRQLRRSSPERLRFVLGPSTWLPSQPEPVQRATWSPYFEHLTYQLENIQPRTGEPSPTPLDLVYPGARYEPLFQGVPREPRVQTANIEKVYPALGRVHVDLAATDAGKPELRLQLTHSMPWFSHYRIRQAGKERTAREAQLEWQLTPGRNELTIVAVNRMHVEGRPSAIALDYFPRRASPTASAGR